MTLVLDPEIPQIMYKIDTPQKLVATYVANTHKLETKKDIFEIVQEIIKIMPYMIIDFDFYKLFDKPGNMSYELSDCIFVNSQQIIERMNNCGYVLQNQFKINYETPEIEKLFNYVSKNERLCIAGGYPTIYYLDKNINNFPDSDIDIFLMCGYDFTQNNRLTPKETFNNLIDFIDKEFEITKISIFDSTDINTTDVNIYPNAYAVYDITCKKIHRTIQIVGSSANMFEGVINSFDSPYSKCCFYLGDTYVTLDAKYSKDIGITWFYKSANEVFSRRTEKAKKLGFKILNPSSKPNLEKKTINLTVEDVKNIELCTIKFTSEENDKGGYF